jgi:hypothetical protein
MLWDKFGFWHYVFEHGRVTGRILHVSEDENEVVVHINNELSVNILDVRKVGTGTSHRVKTHSSKKASRLNNDLKHGLRKSHGLQMG